jgi:hypothetical protein
MPTGRRTTVPPLTLIGDDRRGDVARASAARELDWSILMARA